MFGEKEMNLRIRWLATVWLVNVVLLAIGTEVGGDTSIVTGFLWLIWTAPVGLIWQFYVYDVALKMVPAVVANIGELVLVLALAYTFWFQLMPALLRVGIRNRAP